MCGWVCDDHVSSLSTMFPRTQRVLGLQWATSLYMERFPWRPYVSHYPMSLLERIWKVDFCGLKNNPNSTSLFMIDTIQFDLDNLKYRQNIVVLTLFPYPAHINIKFCFLKGEQKPEYSANFWYIRVLEHFKQHEQCCSSIRGGMEFWPPLVGSSSHESYSPMFYMHTYIHMYVHQYMQIHIYTHINMYMHMLRNIRVVSKEQIFSCGIQKVLLRY